jgi:hypothetical protein
MEKTASCFLFLIIFVGLAHAQADDHKLKELSFLMKAKMSQEMPEWRNRSIRPMEGSKNVVVEECELGEVAVKVAVTQISE